MKHLSLLGISVLMLPLSWRNVDADNFAPQARTRAGSSGRVLNARLVPHWLDDSHFWYRKDLPGEKREYVLVDADKQLREQAFNHERLAQALTDAGVENVRFDELALDDLEFDLEKDTFTFRAANDNWKFDRATFQLSRIPHRDAKPGADQRTLRIENAPRSSTRTGPESELVFTNRTTGSVELFWLDTSGKRHSYGKLAAGAAHRQHTFGGHAWEVVDDNGRTIAVFEAADEPEYAIITGRDLPQRSESPLQSRGSNRDTSPDGKWRAYVRDDNIYVRSPNSDEEIQLSQDGGPDNRYEMLQWSPDSTTLVAFRVEPGEQKEVYLIESAPRDGGRARLHTRNYALPGDRYATYELNLFHVTDWKQSKPEVDRVDFGRPRIRFRADGHRFTYETTDRGHQRFRVIEVDPHSGATRNLIDETTDTFIWTAHTENVDIPIVTWLESSNEFIYASERDGWRRLYLVDANSGQVANSVTNGQYVVRGIDRIDEEERQIWFRASGGFADQDPYFLHHYRVNFNGTGLVALTAGDGNHQVQCSPDRQYLIDTYSRVDTPPVHELRRVSDGQLVCELERADISELEKSGWQPPEVFSAKGRDGDTDIWGIICRPREFDPTKSYPILEDIYAGPQDSYVPKSFSSIDRYASLKELGFIVVKIDGMGTANRSKAFHDVCWQNLKDGGLPDRICWIKAAAQKYPYMDIDRVGVFGTSAGGQNAAAAVLFHPEFYKAAVAACGCHDNRMDKASWNEQWMGYPVGPHYAECSNIENAHRLQGHLMLIVGGMDTNVPPESTLRFADALIRANKDFDLIVIPNAGHGNGGEYGNRRLRDFFVRHLMSSGTN